MGIIKDWAKRAFTPVPEPASKYAADVGTVPQISNAGQSSASGPSVIDIIKSGGTKVDSPSSITDLIKSGGSKGFGGGGGGGGSPPPTSSAGSGGGMSLPSGGEVEVTPTGELIRVIKPSPKTDVQRFNENSKRRKEVYEEAGIGKGASDIAKFNALRGFKKKGTAEDTYKNSLLPNYGGTLGNIGGAPKAIYGGGFIPPTQEEEKSTLTGFSFGGFFSNLMKGETIGKEGFGAYMSNLFNFGGSNVRQSIGGLYTTKGGTYISDSNLLPLELQPSSKLSTSQYMTQQQLRTGESWETIGKPLKIASEIKTEKATKPIFEKYQSGINAGMLTVEEAQKRYEAEAKPIVEKEMNILSSQRAKSEKITSAYTPTSLGSAARFGVETAALTIVPETIVGRAAIGAVLTGLSTKSFTGAISGNKPISERITSAGLGIAELGLGAYSMRTSIGLGTTKSLISKANVRDLNKELTGLSSVFTGKEILKTEKGTLLKLTGSKVIKGGSAKETQEIIAPIFNIEKEGVYGMTESGEKVLLKKGEEYTSLVGGRVKAERKIYDLFSGKTLTATKEYSVGARLFPEKLSKVSLVSPKNKFSQEVPTENLNLGIGSGFVKEKGKEGFTTFRTLSLASEEPTVYKMAEIKPFKIGFGEKNIRIKGKLESLGVVEKLTESEGTEFGSSIFGNIGRKKPTQSLATNQIQKQAIPKISEIVSKKLSSNLGPSKTIIKPSILKGFGINSVSRAKSAYEGFGTYEQTETISASRLSPTQKPALTSALSDMQTTTQRQGLMTFQLPTQTTAQKNKMKSGLMNFQDTIQVPVEKQKIGLVSIPVQKERQKQGLKQIYQFSPATSFKLTSPQLKPAAFTPWKPLVPFGLPPMLGAPLSQKGRVTKPRKYQRRPSLVSVALNIRSRKPARGEYTGIVARPLLTRGSRRGKKR